MWVIFISFSGSQGNLGDNLVDVTSSIGLVGLENVDILQYVESRKRAGTACLLRTVSSRTSTFQNSNLGRTVYVNPLLPLAANLLPASKVIYASVILSQQLLLLVLSLIPTSQPKF